MFSARARHGPLLHGTFKFLNAQANHFLGRGRTCSYRFASVFWISVTDANFEVLILHICRNRCANRPRSTHGTRGTRGTHGEIRFTPGD